MSLLDRTTDKTFPQTRIATLETARLVLRAPRLEDAKPIAMLVNDRRIAENTARIPHPYVLDDATEWINARCGSDRNYVIVHEGEVIGVCGIQMRGDAPEIGYWACRSRAAAMQPKPPMPSSITPLATSAMRCSPPAPASAILPRAACCRNAVPMDRHGAVADPAIRSSAPFDRFRLERAIWASLRNWGAVERRSGV